MSRERGHSERAPDEPELVAYADGRLDPGCARAREIEIWLAAHACARKRVQDYVTQDREIRRHFAPLLAASLPASMRPQAIRRRQFRRRPAWILTTAAALLAAVAMSWSLQLQPETRDLDNFAQLVAHRLTADAAGTPTGPAGRRWSPPGFIPAGFEPVGARRLANTDNLIVEHVYRTADGRSLSLFVGDRRKGGEDAPRWLRIGDQVIVYWKSDSRMYALSGGMSESELDGIAARAMRQTRGNLHMVESFEGEDAVPAPRGGASRYGDRIERVEPQPVVLDQPLL